MRWVPLVFVLAFFALGICLRAWLQRRRHGTWGVVLFAGGVEQKVRDGLLVVLFTAMLVQAIWVGNADLPPDQLAIALPRARAWPLAGLVLMAGGLALLVGSQAQMGRSWRIGIDENARPGLVTSGVYTMVRNPIFVGLWLLLAGFLAAVPTWVSLVQLLGTSFGIHRQVRAEENWLQRTYGADYLAYAARVGRFVPLLGRLRRS
jgi:protein-S-isoprenylcysteine O-methyltransferase Ste14